MAGNLHVRTIWRLWLNPTKLLGVFKGREKGVRTGLGAKKGHSVFIIIDNRDYISNKRILCSKSIKLYEKEEILGSSKEKIWQ